MLFFAQDVCTIGFLERRFGLRRAASCPAFEDRPEVASRGQRNTNDPSRTSLGAQSSAPELAENH
jgi:hypothetical protein